MEVNIPLKLHTKLKKIGNPERIVKELVQDFINEYQEEEKPETEETTIEEDVDYSDMCNDFGEQEDIEFCNECKENEPALFNECKKVSED